MEGKHKKLCWMFPATRIVKTEEIINDDYLPTEDIDKKDIWETLHHIRQCRM